MKKKATINQTIKIAKALGGESLHWVDNLSYEEADALIKRLPKKKEKVCLHRRYSSAVNSIIDLFGRMVF